METASFDGERATSGLFRFLVTAAFGACLALWFVGAHVRFPWQERGPTVQDKTNVLDVCSQLDTHATFPNRPVGTFKPAPWADGVLCAGLAGLVQFVQSPGMEAADVHVIAGTFVWAAPFGGDVPLDPSLQTAACHNGKRKVGELVGIAHPHVQRRPNDIPYNITGGDQLCMMENGHLALIPLDGGRHWEWKDFHLEGR